MKLTHDAYEAARAFVKERARPLDQARLAFFLDDGPEEGVWQELEAFQNADGGFGHGLEPDVQTPASSVLATSVALQLLRETGAPMTHSLVKGAVRYLMDTYEVEAKRWPLLPPEAQASPRAPWWHDDGSLAANFGEFRVNPRVELVGYLFDYALLAPHTMMEELVPAISAQIRELPDELGMHDLLCYVRLAETATLPHNIKAELVPALQERIAAQVGRSAEAWRQYSLKPTMVVASPDSPFVDGVADLLDDNLAFEIQAQADDGGWHPSWSWGGLYPDAWTQAEQTWAGKLTVEQLRLLRNFDRL